MNLLSCYFEGIGNAYKKKEEFKGYASESYIILGNATIKLRFLSPAISPVIMPAFSHACVQSAARVDLTVYVWDSTDHIGVPPGPASQSNQSFQQYFTDEQFDVLCELWPHRISALDRKNNIAFFWINDITQIPWWHKAAPLRTILTWWASSRGQQFVHAAAVGFEAGGVLLGGKGGSGKTWAALSCLESPLSYAGDDYCLLGFDRGPQVYCTYSMAKLKGIEDVKTFPNLESLLLNRERLDTEKAMFDIVKKYPGKIINSFPLKAVLLPRVSPDGDFSLQPVSKHEAIREIVSSTARQSQRYSEHDFYSFYRIVHATPCYSFNVGPDIARIPVVIGDLLIRGSV